MRWTVDYTLIFDDSQLTTMITTAILLGGTTTAIIPRHQGEACRGAAGSNTWKSEAKSQSSHGATRDMH
jgi:hypothetical protein